jgi:hypothetical protein
MDLLFAARSSIFESLPEQKLEKHSLAVGVSVGWSGIHRL